MTNQYIEEGILQDAYSDHETVRQLRYILSEASAMCVKFENDQAMAYNQNLIAKVNGAIADILTNILEPTEDQINEAIRFHENDPARIQGLSREDGRQPTPIS
jgi:hypothetical protein